ncbi:MAG: hydantoinase/oxoprolinase family protein [Acidimicrobiales bacterium]|nr:hydantoinase/oxoprolinase family protein [Acidimicrobiales bacterium]MYH73869.1 hydantoinase/oxoprolinase family protein [Acidimicrobiales bacterium]MYK72794.1 hydantoinase/oxoprolinase family protein [Acidimicrobiales bacterium]
MRIGVDVGGTNTDAVAMSGDEVAGWAKAVTTSDVTAGIVTAVRSLLAGDDLSAAEIGAVMIGTTHFTNALVEGRRLVPTAVVRLGLPATKGIPPFIDWPDRLREVLGDHVYLCHGGHEFDGRLITPIDHGELRAAARDIASKGVRSVAVASVFSPVDDSYEHEAQEVLLDEVPGLDISLSGEIGRLGLLERENAAIVNACLRPLAERTVAGLVEALVQLGLDCPLHVSQNDGTLMSADFARRYPVATFASGPTNSMRGAAFLSGIRDGVVIDVGGTTSDIGVLVHGFPREASTAVSVAGVRTNFRMPDVLSLGLGGGSLVRSANGAAAGVTVGPDSVGYELTERALVFGGVELTATDVATASGMAEIGDASTVDALDETLVGDAVDRMQDMLSTAVEQMKTSADPVPVVIVGGGGVLVRDGLAGASETIRPDHFSVASAIGAAIAQVGAETDRVYSMASMTRDEAMTEARSVTAQRAVDAGADAATVEITDVDEIPLTYLPSNAIRIRVKAVGDLAAGNRASSGGAGT